MTYNIYLVLPLREKWIARVCAASLGEALEFGVPYGIDRLTARDTGVTADGDVLRAERM